MDKNGNTPLHLAGQEYGSSQNKFDMAELLVNNGADVCVKNNIGKTPADVAATDQSNWITMNLSKIICFYKNRLFFDLTVKQLMKK